MPLVALFLCFRYSVLRCERSEVLSRRLVPDRRRPARLSADDDVEVGSDLPRAQSRGAHPADRHVRRRPCNASPASRARYRRLHGVQSERYTRGAPPPLEAQSGTPRDCGAAVDRVGTDSGGAKRRAHRRARPSDRACFKSWPTMASWKRQCAEDHARRDEASWPSERPARTSYLGRETLLTSGDSKMFRWRKALFSSFRETRALPPSISEIPPDRVVELGMQIDL